MVYDQGPASKAREEPPLRGPLLGFERSDLLHSLVHPLPQYAFLTLTLFRSPQMVLCRVHLYDRHQDVHPLHIGRQKRPWATQTRPRGQLLRSVAEIRRKRAMPRLQGHKDTEVTPLHRVQCVCGALRPPLLLDKQLCRR